jgi:hypothetical protein
MTKTAKQYRAALVKVFGRKAVTFDGETATGVDFRIDARGSVFSIVDKAAELLAPIYQNSGGRLPHITKHS